MGLIRGKIQLANPSRLELQAIDVLDWLIPGLCTCAYQNILQFNWICRY